MKKGFGRLLSILISAALVLGCIPQAPGLILSVQAAEEVVSEEPLIVESTEESTEETMTEEVVVEGPSEDELPLTDADVAQWMDENGLGSGRIINGEGEALPQTNDTACYKGSIIVDNEEKTNISLKDAFALAQTSSKEKVPEIRLKENMFIDEPITIKSGKTIHLKLDCQSLFRAPKGSGEKNKFYVMDKAETNGNMFELEEDAKLIITGGKLAEEQTGIRFVQKGVTFRESEKTYTYKTGRLVGGYTSDEGGAIYANSKSTVDLRDLTIVNSAAKYGGAIYAESQANIQLTNTKIVGNFSRYNGGAIYLNGAKGVLTMDNSTEITANRANGLGGAICLNSEKMIITGYGDTSINNNLAEGNGGAIYFPNSSSNSIAGLKFKNNVSMKYGGAIFTNGSGTSISNSEFNGNYANWGGGIYINAKNCGISSIVVEQNRAQEQGGGIWVDSRYDPGISGTTVVKNNTGKNGAQDNIALQNANFSQSYICLSGALGTGSEVWLHDTSGESRRLTSQVGNYDVRNFHVDGEQKHVEYRENRHLFIADGREDDPTKNRQKAEVTDVSYNDWKTRDITKATSEAEGKTDYQFAAADGSYPVYYGYVSSPSHTTENGDIVSKYYYSDGFFFCDPKKYDNHLAAFGMNMAMASADSNVNTHEDYRYKFTNIKSLMQQVGVDEEDIYINSWYPKKPTVDSIGLAVGKKTIKNVAGDEYKLLLVAVRSYGYEKEWGGNMTLNGSNTENMNDEHSGFKSARTRVMEELKYYISNYGLEEDINNGKVRFFITGFSRGSATANLTGKCLVDTYGENSELKNKNQVYAYCYGVPAGGTDYKDNSKESGKSNECYFCIHNIINKVDLTPMVAPYEMGFKRYGVDHYIPGDPTVMDTPQQADKPAEVEEKVDNVTLYYDNTPWYVGEGSYKEQREKMVKHLLAVNEELSFIDYFKEYYITMGKMNYLFRFEPYSFNQASGSNKKLENWLPEFYHKLQVWNILSSDAKLTRENYSNYVMKEGESDKQWFNNGVSGQTVLRGLVQLLKSKTPEESAKLMAAISGVTNKFNSPVIGSGNTLLTLYNDLIGDDEGWDKSRAIQQKWLDEMWNKLTDNRYGQQGIQDAMSPAELKEFKTYFPTLMGLVFRILKYDYDNAGKMDKSTKGEMWIAGTFAKNTDAILQGHVPEIALAWLRSYDDWYDNDLKKIVYTGPGSADVPAPKVMKKDAEGKLAEITEDEVLSGEDQTVYLANDHDGAAVFYLLESNGTQSEPMLYNGDGIKITKPGSYKITAYSINDHAVEAEKANHDKYWTRKWKESEKISRSFRLETQTDKEDTSKPTDTTEGEDDDDDDETDILAVYDEDIWLIVKVDETSGKLIFEDVLADDLEEKTADATWEGLNRLLPRTIAVLSDDDSVDSLPVTWERPEADEFVENVLNTQIFYVLGRAELPDGSTIDVFCDVFIETTESVEKPYAMPAGGTYYKNVSVTLGTETEDAKIWYTLDGSEPLDDLGNPLSTAKLYEKDIYIDTPGETVLKAAAVKDGLDNSETVTERYTIVAKPEADIPEDDLIIISAMFLEDGMCLDDLTPYLPDGWSWDEDQDIYYEYRLDEMIEDKDSENNMLHTAYGALIYNPDPEKYLDTYIDVSIPVYTELGYVDVIDGEAYSSDGDLIYGAEAGDKVYLVASYPQEILEDYVFDKWIVQDEAGNVIPVTMADNEHVNDYPDPLVDKEDGVLFDGAASFVMPERNVIAKAIFERYDMDKKKVEEKTVQSLLLDRSELILKAGDDKTGSGTVEATVTYEGEGTEPVLSFRSSDPDVIRLIENGNKAEVTAVKAGEAVIWAACGDKVAKCLVTVVPGPADSVNVTVTGGRAQNDAGAFVTAATKGDVLTLVADKPATGYEFRKWKITGASQIKGDTDDPAATIKITVGTNDIRAEAIFGIVDSYDDDFKPKNADVPVKKLTLDNKEYHLTSGNDFTLKAEAVYNEKQPEIEFRSNNPGVVSVSAGKTVSGKASAIVRGLKAGEATVYAYCGNKTAKCKVYVVDGSKGLQLTGNNGKTLIDLRAGEQIALDAKLMPENSVKQVASVKFQILSKFDVAALNAPLKTEINNYPALKAMSGKKLPSIVSASKGLLTAKWDKKLTGTTSEMTVLRVTMKLVKDKGEKKAVEYVCDYPVRVAVTDYETKGYKNTAADKSYKLSAKAERSTLDTGVAGMGETVVTATVSKAEMKDSLAIEFISTNENVIKIENAQTTAVPDAKGSKATATATAKAKGIGTAYVVVKSKNKTDETKYNLRTVKITVKSSSPKIVLVKDSEGLLPRDENTGDVVIDEATNSVTMTMRPGSYDRFIADLKPYVTESSTDATKLSWSASGGVSVKNGVVFAKKATKEGKPAKVTIKCAKSKPLTIYINVK